MLGHDERTRPLTKGAVVADYLTPDEVCEILNINKRALDRLILNRSFPVTKVGRLNRFPRAEFDAWLSSQTRGAHA